MLMNFEDRNSEAHKVCWFIDF